MKRFIPLIGLFVVIGALLACGESNTGTIASSTDSSKSDTTPTAPSRHFNVGETVDIGKIWQVTVNNVRTDPGGEYSILKPGNVYLLIDVDMKNVSQKEEQLFGTAGWTVKDTQGQKYDSTFFSGAPAAPDGKIEPGDPAKGTLAFEVPSGTKTFTLAYEQNVFSSGQTVWDITVP